MLRPVKDVVDAAGLDNLAALHHRDAVGHAPRHRQVVGDQDDRHAHPRLQLLQELQDLRLDGDVDRRRRLVGDEQVGLVGERHGDHDALALAARQLMGKRREPLRRVADADQLQQLERAPARRLGQETLVDQEHLVDLLLDPMQRVERGQRLLEDHRDAVAADAAHDPLAGADQLGAAKADAALRVPRDGVGQELQDRQGRDRLARAAFADHRQGLALLDAEADALDRLDLAHRRAERDVKVLDLEQRRVL